ncbi:phage tail protein [Clostridium sp. CMCC3677]|uniref:phage tail protein n=1 Tax=Clostridium sp. CMCC3677 TaxID=2949963 RepID=UPI0013F13ACA|nr:phage tail protein [Clostridium sp. CMCC3677]NFG60531.1 phage tail protein [Clostridium botulinum]NFQ09826.1 phage tail protein [Clostridium botulinum]
MKEKFYTILTNIGKAKIANSSALGSKVNFAKIKAGDGNGKYHEPTEDQIKLVNTVWEGNIRNIEVTKENPNWIEIEAIIPSDEGGFTIREFGAFDEEGNLLAISKCPETYKPIICDGSIKELLIKMVLSVSNTDNVSLKIDPTIVVAKKSDVEKVSANVDEIKSQMKDIANKVDNIKIADATITKKGIVQLNNTTNSTSITQAATANAVKLAMDRANSAFQSASDGKNAIAGKVGNVTGSNTHAEIANKIQTDKNTAATNLSNKGVSANGNEALASLVSKIANISIQEMGGKLFTSGTIKKGETVNLGFVPSVLIGHFWEPNFHSLAIYVNGVRYSVGGEGKQYSSGGSGNMSINNDVSFTIIGTNFTLGRILNNDRNIMTYIAYS